jgi:hypothetical protein
MQPKSELRGKNWFGRTDLLDATANLANDYHAGEEVLAGNGTQPNLNTRLISTFLSKFRYHVGVQEERHLKRHLSGLVSMTIEDVVVSAVRHCQKEILKIFFEILGKQSYAKNASVSLFDRGSFFGSLLLERLDYCIFKVSHK